MSRPHTTDAATLRPTSEADRWPPSLQRLWADAGTAQQRAALRYRWRLRAAYHPEALPMPDCPLLRGLHMLEVAYRRGSYCRGAVEIE